MSYILDALKKADDKRQEEQTSPLHLGRPTAKRPQNGSADRRSWLLWAAALLLALPPALLYLYQLHADRKVPVEMPTQQPPNGAPMAEQAEAGEPPPEAPGKDAAAAPMPTAAEVPELRPTSTKVAYATQSAAHEDVIVEPAPLMLVRQTALVQQPASVPLLPALEDLDAAFRQSLPELHLAGHVYSDDPALRMILINHRVFREKETVNKDLVLDEITPEGIILRAGGVRFRMKGY